MLLDGVTELKRSTSLGYTALLAFSKIIIINKISRVLHNVTTLTSPWGGSCVHCEACVAAWTVFGLYRFGCSFNIFFFSGFVFQHRGQHQSFQRCSKSLFLSYRFQTCFTLQSHSCGSSPALAERTGSKSCLSTHGWSVEMRCRFLLFGRFTAAVAPL